MGNEGRVVRRDALKWDTVEASLQVQHANPLSLPELQPVPPHVIALIVVLGHTFMDWDNVLAYPVGLPGLNAWYKQQQRNTLQLFPWQDGANHSLSYQLVQVDTQLGFLLRMQVGRLCPDGHSVGEVQMVVVLRVPDPLNIHLDSWQLIYTWQKAEQEGMLCGFTNCVPKLALRKCPKPAK